MGGRDIIIPKWREGLYLVYKRFFFTANWVNYMWPPFFKNQKKSIDFGVHWVQGWKNISSFLAFLRKLLTRNGEAEVFFFAFVFCCFLSSRSQTCPPKDFRKAIRTLIRTTTDINIGVKPGVSAAINSGPHLQPCSLGCCYTIPLFLVLKRSPMIRNHEVTWKKVNRWVADIRKDHNDSCNNYRQNTTETAFKIAGYWWTTFGQAHC